MSEYEAFLARKQLVVPNVGIEVHEADLPDAMFPWQRAVTRWALRKGRAAIFANTGLGKALASDTGVMTPTGCVPIGTLSAGDSVIGANGQPTSVLGVFPQGQRPGYRVTFSDDTSVVCDAEHLWQVRTKSQRYRGETWSVLTLQEMMDRGLGGANEHRHDRWFIPMVEAPVQFAEQDLPLHPYVLGCLIGDGHVKQGVPMLSTADEEMVERIEGLLPAGMTIEKRRYSQYDYAIVRDGRRSGKQGGHHENPIVVILRELGVWGHGAESKFIPEAYKFAAVDTRTWLLQGLLDTDGSVHAYRNTSTVEFTTVSQRLAEDVLFLIQSLGGRGRIRTKPTNRRMAYRITPAFPVGIEPFALSRKRERYRERIKYQPSRSIRSVEPIGPIDMTCISVAAEDGLFVVDGFVVTHNTIMQLAWAQHAADRTLILAPLAVARQTVREGERWGIEVTYVRQMSDTPAHGITITNYEMADHFDAGAFGAVVLDESSILKAHDGKTRGRLIAQFRDTPMRLCCTATPAPNDIAELANHAEFLGILSRAEMLATFFVHDDEGWRLKGHAKEPFYRWLASWGLSVTRPSDLGFSDEGYDLPPLSIEPVILPVDYTPPDQLFFTTLKGITDRSIVRKATVEARVQAAVDLITRESDEPWLVWVGLNDEGRLLAKQLHEAVLVEGSQSVEHKTRALLGFSDGDIRILLSKVSISGFGMNWQHCRRMVFVGLGDSYEQYFQAIRRCWRFGQEQPVTAYVVLTEPEEAIYHNVLRKEREAEAMARELVQHVAAFAKGELAHVSSRDPYTPSVSMTIPAWL